MEKQNRINFADITGRSVQDYNGNKFVIYQGVGWKCTFCTEGDAVLNFNGVIVECETLSEADIFINNWYSN